MIDYKENWYALAIAILTTCTVNQSFQVLRRGGFKKRYHQWTSEDFRDVEKLRRDGCTWDDIGRMFNVSRTGACNQYMRWKRRVS